MSDRVQPLLHALHGTAGLPWLADIARRFAALAETGDEPGPAEHAELLHGLVGVGQLLSQLAAELQAEHAALTRRDQALTQREAALSEQTDSARSTGEELINLIAIADAKIVALKQLTDR